MKFLKLHFVLVQILFLGLFITDNISAQCNAGSDVLTTKNSTIVLTGTPSTGTWSALSSNGAGDSLKIIGGGVANAQFNSSATGTYKYVYTDGSCTDTMQITIKNYCEIYPTNSSTQSQSFSYNGTNSLATGSSRQGVTCNTFPAGSSIRMTFTNFGGSIPPTDTAYFSVTQGIFSPFPTFVPTSQPIYFTLEQLLSGEIYLYSTNANDKIFEFQYYIKGPTTASFSYTWTPTALECLPGKPSITPSTAQNSCPATTLNLTTLPNSNSGLSGFNTTVVWSNHYPLLNSFDTLTTAQATAINTSGTYYAYYRDIVSGCFRGVDSVAVTITNCSAVCGISTISATPSTCNSINNQYSVTGSIAFTNPPSTGTLTVSVGATQQVFNAPFTSPQSYTLSGLTSDGMSHTVTAVFSADANCTKTTNYTAPNSCNGCQPIQCGTTTYFKN